MRLNYIGGIFYCAEIPTETIRRWLCLTRTDQNRTPSVKLEAGKPGAH